MVEALAAQVGDSLEGIVASWCSLPRKFAGFRYFRGGHPTPNAESIQAASAILRALRRATGFGARDFFDQRRRLVDRREAHR